MLGLKRCGLFQFGVEPSLGWKTLTFYLKSLNAPFFPLYPLFSKSQITYSRYGMSALVLEQETLH